MEQFSVTGMSCAACSARVEKAVSSVKGVTSCSVSLLTNSMGVEGTAPAAEIIRAVEADIHIRGVKLVRTGISSFIFQIGSIIQGSGGKNKRQHEKSNPRRCAGGKPPQKGTESALKTKRILL